MVHLRNPIKKLLKINSLLTYSLLLFSTILCYSQDNFLEGYVISLEGDTIKGSINYQNWGRNPKVITFKNAHSGTATAYEPNDISSFFVSNEHYKSAQIWIDYASNKLDDLGYEYKPKLNLEHVFLTTLVKGTTNLYHLNDKNGKGHFFYEKDSIVELIDFRFLKETDGQEHIVYPKKYKGQLLFYMNNCENLKTQINNVHYKTSSLSKIVKNYNECVGGQNTYVKRKETLGVRWFIGVGIAKNSLKFTDSKVTKSILGSLDHKGSNNFNFGGSLEVVLLRNRKKWSIYNEVFYRSYRATGTQKKYDPKKAKEVKSEFNMSYLKLDNLLRYTFITPHHIRPFINFGIFNAFALKKENIIQEKTFYRPLEIKPAIPNLRVHEQGLVLGTGVLRKKIGLEARIEIGNGMSPYPRLNSVTKSYQLLLNYKLL